MAHGEMEDWLGPATSLLRTKLNALLSRRRLAEALKLLDRFVANRQLHLWIPDEVLESKRQLAWLYKVNLLRSMGRSREALAWTCLECELNPRNATAQAMKEDMKAALSLADRKRPARQRRDAEEGDFWDGVAGMRELKAVLERDVILPLRQPAIYRRYKLSLPNGVLLYGPPGCGKTFIAEKLGRIIGYHVMSVKPSDLGSIYVHGTQKAVGELFDRARERAPCMVFLDELDALIPNRAGDLSHHYGSEVNEFLTQLNKAADQRVLVVGATNRIEKLDPAALRPGRFDKKVYVGPPDAEARAELVIHYLRGRPQDEIDIAKIASEADGYTCAELEHIVNEAARRALQTQRSICTADLIGALAANPPAMAS